MRTWKSIINKTETVFLRIDKDTKNLRTKIVKLIQLYKSEKCKEGGLCSCILDIKSALFQKGKKGRMTLVLKPSGFITRSNIKERVKTPYCELIPSFN